MNPEKHLLGNVGWQFFGTLTFKSLKVKEGVWLKMYFSMIREQADNFGVHFSKILWALRYELGEQTGRPHFHALIAGLPNSAVTVATCFSFMKIWEKHGGGQSRVRVYDPSLAGVEYVLKGVDEAFAKVVGANWYELNKFGQRCDVMLSMSLIRHMENRSRFGHRGRDGLFEGKLSSSHNLSQAFRRDEEDRRDGDTQRGGVRRVLSS
jgi:hypothetical protein